MSRFEAGASKASAVEDRQKPQDDLASVMQLREIAHSLELDLSDLIRHVRRHSGLRLDVYARANGDWVLIDELSAGQLLLLSTIARVVSNIEPGSLVLIDEPETGLHPAWQSEFIPLLRATVPESYGCHFFLATHSPHLVSDGSDVLVPGELRGAFVEYEEAFFGRSVENLLYRVFATRVTGNKSVDDDLALLLVFCSEVDPDPAGIEPAREALTRLDALSGPDTQKLNELLSQARDRIERAL